MSFYRTVDTAVEALKELRPDMTEPAAKRNAARIRSHLGRDYSNSRGLLTLGHAGNKTKNFIEFYVGVNGRVDIEYMIAVDIDGQWEVFDAHELLCNNEFIIGASELESRLEEAKKIHIQNRREENYVEQV